MKIFIDSADLDEIKQVYSWGIADGVTTNPSLIKKAVDKRENLNLHEYINQILTIAKNTPVSLEVTETKDVASDTNVVLPPKHNKNCNLHLNKL